MRIANVSQGMDTKTAKATKPPTIPEIALLMLRVSRNCRIEVNFAELRAVCSSCAIYNTMKRDVLVELAKKLEDAFVSYWNEGNRNNGMNPLEVTVGNEDSFCIRATLYGAYVPRCGGTKVVRERLEATLSTEDDHYHLRLWWD